MTDRAAATAGYSVLFIVLALGIAGWVVLAQATAGPEAAAAQAVRIDDPPTLGAVEHLRQELHLGDGDLALLGCTPAGAEAVLGGLITWHADHRVQLTAAQSAGDTAQAKLQTLNRAAAAGLASRTAKLGGVRMNTLGRSN